MDISAVLGAIPIIFYDSKRRAMPAMQKRLFGLQDAPLETQDVLQRMFFEIFARVCLRHPGKQIFQLLSLCWLRKRASPHHGKDFS